MNSNDLSRYREVRDFMGPGDVIAFRGDGWLSSAIRRFTEYSHVASVAWEVRGRETRRMIVEADEGEVNARVLSHKLEEYEGGAWWYALRPALDRHRRHIEIFLTEHVGVHYDYLGMLANINERPRVDPDKLYCSEFTGASLYHPREASGKWRADPGIPRGVLEEMLPHPELQLLLDGYALMPGDITALPLWRPAVRLIGKKHEKEG